MSSSSPPQPSSASVSSSSDPTNLNAPLPDPHQSPHVAYIFLAEFDIDKGTTLKFQYPRETGTDPQILAELMVPEGAQHRSEDWTAFYLNQVPALRVDGAIPQNSNHNQESTATDGVSGSGGAGTTGNGDRMLFVLSLMRNKLNPEKRRGADYKAMALASYSPYIHIWKPLLLLALESYFLSPSITVLSSLYNSINSLDTSLAPILTEDEKLVLRQTERRDIFEEKWAEREEQVLGKVGGAGGINTGLGVGVGGGPLSAVSVSSTEEVMRGLGLTMIDGLPIATRSDSNMGTAAAATSSDSSSTTTSASPRSPMPPLPAIPAGFDGPPTTSSNAIPPAIPEGFDGPPLAPGGNSNNSLSSMARHHHHRPGLSSSSSGVIDNYNASTTTASLSSSSITNPNTSPPSSSSDIQSLKSLHHQSGGANSSHHSHSNSQSQQSHHSSGSEGGHSSSTHHGSSNHSQQQPPVPPLPSSSSSPQLSQTQAQYNRPRAGTGMSMFSGLSISGPTGGKGGPAVTGGIGGGGGGAGTRPKDTHFFESRVTFQGLTLPVRIPLASFREDVGDYHLIKLIQTFSHAPPPPPSVPLHPHLHTSGRDTHPIIVLFNAILTEKRVVFLGQKNISGQMNTSSGQVAAMVEAACALGSGCGAVFQQGLTARCFPYADLKSLEYLQEVPGFIAGVVNPVFEFNTTDWDVLFNIDNCTVTISKDIAPAPMNKSNPSVHSPTSPSNPIDFDGFEVKEGGAGGGGNLGKSNVVSEKGKGVDTGDQAFMDEITGAIQAHFGEAVIRARFTDYLQRFIRIAARYEEERYGSTSLSYPSRPFNPHPSSASSCYSSSIDQLGSGFVASDGSVGSGISSREIDANAARIEGWRQTKSYRLYKLRYQQQLQGQFGSGGESRKSSSQGWDLNHQLWRLRLGRKLSGQEMLAISRVLSREIKADGQVIQLLALMPSHLGGLLPLSFGLFHSNEEVRHNIVELFDTLNAHPTGQKFLQSLNAFQRLAYTRLSQSRTSQTATVAPPFPIPPPPIPQAFDPSHNYNNPSFASNNTTSSSSLMLRRRSSSFGPNSAAAAAAPGFLTNMGEQPPLPTAGMASVGFGNEAERDRPLQLLVTDGPMT